MPLWLWEPHKLKFLRHLLKDFRLCQVEEKQKLLANRSDYLAKDGLSKSTRSQTSFQKFKTPIDFKPTTGRLTTTDKTINLSYSPSCLIVVSDGMESLKCTGRFDDGSDDSISSAKIVQAAVLT